MVNNFIGGLTILFSKPSNTPARRNSLMPPLIINPGTNKKAAYIATELPKILIKKPSIGYSIMLTLKRFCFNRRSSVQFSVIRNSKSVSLGINLKKQVFNIDREF